MSFSIFRYNGHISMTMITNIATATRSLSRVLSSAMKPKSGNYFRFKLPIEFYLLLSSASARSVE